MGAFIDLFRTSSPDTSQHRACDLSDENDHYQWELIDSKVLQTALNFRQEIQPWTDKKNKLKNQIYTIIKGYLTLRLDNLDNQTSAHEIRTLFNQALTECNPEFIIKAYSKHQSFSKLLSDDMSRIVWHDIHQGCSRFSCDTLYISQDGTKSIASILFNYPQFTTFQGTTYRGIFEQKDFLHLQVDQLVMSNTFLSTSKNPDVAHMFANYNPMQKQLYSVLPDRNISVGFTFSVKNLNGNR